MNFIDELRNIFGRSELRNPVPEIEDVPRVIAVTIEHRPGLLANGRRGREQRRGIEIALQGDARADSLAGRTQIDRPIEPDRVHAARGDIVEPKAPALRERDDRHAAPDGASPGWE